MDRRFYGRLAGKFGAAHTFVDPADGVTPRLLKKEGLALYPETLNQLGKELQTKLRKRKYFKDKGRAKGAPCVERKPIDFEGEPAHSPKLSHFRQWHISQNQIRKNQIREKICQEKTNES